MGKVLVALIVLIVAAVVFEWLRTPVAPSIPVATTGETPATARTASDTDGSGSVASGAATPDPRPARPPGSPKAIDLQVNSESDLLAAMSSLGIEDLDDRMTRWSLSRGYPEFDQAGNYLLDQPYQQYDEATLRGLAEADDMWAQQILAQQVASDRPAEAIEWYKRAAANGSVYAMQEVARLYHKMSTQVRSSDDGGNGAGAPSSITPDAGAPEVTAYAWLVAAERSGWDATRGGSLIPLIGRKLSQDQVTAACAMADGLRSQMSAQRSSRGMQPFDRTPPPIVYSAEDMGASTQCHADESTAFDLSGCREANVHTGATSTHVWVCTPQG